MQTFILILQIFLFFPLSLFPKANVTRLGPWSHFNCTYSCAYVLEPRDPLFLSIGSLFLSQVLKKFGTDHIYNTDTFNEMTPTSSDPAYLSSMSRAVFTSMTSGNLRHPKSCSSSFSSSNFVCVFFKSVLEEKLTLLSSHKKSMSLIGKK